MVSALGIVVMVLGQYLVVIRVGPLGPREVAVPWSLIMAWGIDFVFWHLAPYPGAPSI